MPVPERVLSTRVIASDDLVGFVDGLVAHETRCLVGIDPETLAERLTEAPRRPILSLALTGAGDTAQLIAQAIDGLANAVATLWPYLWGGEDLGALRDDALSLAHLPLRLSALAGRHPDLSRTWAGETVPRLLRGHAPRLARPSSAVEWRQLALAFSPQGLILVVPWRAGVTFVAAVEWLARHASVSVLVVAKELPAESAFERLLFGAAMVADAPRDREIERPASSDERLPSVIALPETEGRPHPQSAAELKIYGLIQADPELRLLFAFNRIVPDLPLLAAKADILWREGRLVVELDGDDHRGAAKYRADRRRDATLLLAGWRVLRFTNEDIMIDAARALATIRDAVRLIAGEAR